MPEHRDTSTGRYISAPATAALAHGIFATHHPSTAWLAGLIAADGNVSQDRKRISLAQSGPAGLEVIQEARRLTNHHLSVGRNSPHKGNTSYSITLGSPQMIDDLERRFGIMPRKSLVYRWPALPASLIRPFLRGYVDGDGCVGIYRTPQGKPMLHLSFVGTPEFIQAAMAHLPARGLYRRIERCAALAEIRYNGRHAWKACSWLYADPGLLRTSKARTFNDYCSRLAEHPPVWFLQSQRRQTAMSCLASGSTAASAATAAGVRVETVQSWLRQARNPRTGMVTSK